MLELEENDATLIFRRTKTGAAELAERLEGRGFAAVAMHGDMKQNERESVIRRLRAGTIEIVVATDVAARGLDVEQITHVVNFDVPYDVEAYVHRIGRTGRAGRKGVATLFVTPRERKMMREIERYTKSPIKPMRIPTQSDVAARRVSQLKETIRKNLAEGDLDLYLEIVEQLAEEGPNDMAEIAAAAVRLASATRPIAEKEIPQVAALSSVATGASPVVEPDRRGRPSPHRKEDNEPKTRISMSVGKRDGIRPADVVGSIANEANVAGRDIGPIEIRDDITYVVIPTRYVDQVLQKVGRKRFRGKALNVKVAGGDASAPQTKRPAFNKFIKKGSGPKRKY
jgi:ATP-dependent RNA helicase DeaD